MQVFDEYSQFARGGGLTPEGLQQIYADGIGNADIDFATLGLSLVRFLPADNHAGRNGEALWAGPIHRGQRSTKGGKL